MKHSIKKIFANLSNLLILLTVLGTLLLLLTLEQNYSFEKVSTLQEQKQVLHKLTTLEKRDIDTALIQFNGKSTHILYQIDHLESMYALDLVGQMIIGNKSEYSTDLRHHKDNVNNFNEKARLYYTKEPLSDEEEQQYEANFYKAFQETISHIDRMLLRDLNYNKTKSSLIKVLSIAIFALIFMTMLWYRKRLAMIYSDIFYLYSIESSKKGFVTFSEEGDAIALRMKRKPTASSNPAMLDPLTEINNTKGMIASYGEKKGMKDGNFTSVTIFEIDNISRNNKAIPHELSQTILKKVAYTISLHEQATDVVARTDHNQFTIIFSRMSKEQSFKDVELIRQSITELNFKTPNREDVRLSVSGGFLIKPNSTPLEEAIRQAKELLQYAQKNMKNAIAQKRDLAEIADNALH